MSKYRKRPVVIEAMKVPRPGYEHREVGMALQRWLDAGGCIYSVHPDATFYIQTLEGEMRADPGDYIIRGVGGEFYPCKPDIFAATYEACDD